MADTQTVRVTTIVTPTDFAEAIASVWPSIVGGEAPPNAILVLMAHSAYETGAWISNGLTGIQNRCSNWNMAGLKHLAGDGHDYFLAYDDCTDSEGNRAYCMFRSYDTLEDGTADYLSLLYRHYRTAWPYVMAGDPVDFVAAIRAQGYFTGSLTNYTNGVVAYFRKFGGIVPAPSIAMQSAMAASLGLLGTAVYYAWTVWRMHRGTYNRAL